MNESEQSSHLKVTDRRHFTTMGERRPDVPDAEPAAGGAGKVVEMRRDGAPAANAAPPQPPAPAVPPEPLPEPLPEDERVRGLNFANFIESLYATAMLQLGAVAQPGMIPGPPDLVGARETIELIALLEQKTRGNLDVREKQMMDGVLYELRMAFAEMTRRVTAPPPPGGPKPSKTAPRR